MLIEAPYFKEQLIRLDCSVRPTQGKAIGKIQPVVVQDPLLPVPHQKGAANSSPQRREQVIKAETATVAQDTVPCRHLLYIFPWQGVEGTE